MNTKKAFCCAFATDPNVVITKLGSKVINIGVMEGVEEEVINIGNNYNFLANEQTGVKV